ncbi:hypothetical protein PIB30_077107 [Stylosanthes scabra]|uniref:Aminotransferase-like plant mobile domain-containing protein n=1 Tax=Stylosanthes scabra TaxID=79078 RepID=A0ABU6RQR3_9FABA|nr:hypothetical protein [Stylosanthes scabra]
MSAALSWGSAVLAWSYRSLCDAARRGRTDVAGCILLVISWIYHRFPRFCPRKAHRLLAAGQRQTRRQATEVARGIGQIRHRAFRWTRTTRMCYRPLFPIGSALTSRYIHGGLRQYGGEQPVPRAPVDLTRLMTSTGRGEDRWWPDTLRPW